MISTVSDIPKRSNARLEGKSSTENGLGRNSRCHTRSPFLSSAWTRKIGCTPTREKILPPREWRLPISKRISMNGSISSWTVSRGAARQQCQARSEKEREGCAKARVVPIGDVLEKGGETVIRGSEESSLDLIAA